MLRSSTILTIGDLAGSEASVHRFRVAAARDVVLVVVFEDGAGLISYQKLDGALLHTLNTAEGLQRKLRQLDITLVS